MEPSTSSTCPLHYPERFTAAVKFVESIPKDTELSEEAKLLLYALQQQATIGPCNEPRPWGWNVINNAKWQSWKQLGDLSSVEAMRLYVRTLEEEHPNWWDLISNLPTATTTTAALFNTDTTSQLSAALSPQEANNYPLPSKKTTTASSDDQSTPTTTTTTAPPPPLPPQPTIPQPTPPSPLTTDTTTTKSLPPPQVAHKNRSVAEVVVEGSWVSPYITSDRKPPPRYEHAVTLVNNQVYIIGGNCGGRYINDTWALNLEDLTWTCVSGGGRSAALSAASEVQLVPTAGHAAVTWNGQVLVFGGHTRAADVTDYMAVRSLDPKTGLWTEVETYPGDEDSVLPAPRGGHTATLIGSRLFIFGGEDVKRRSLNELWVLDLPTMTWTQPATAGTTPPGRGAHTAVAFRGRYIMIFGGGGIAQCHTDVHALDTHTMEWWTPEVTGNIPPARAGHAAALLGTTWYVIGGGNNAAGCADMYSVDLSPLGTGPLEWVLIGNTPPASAIASEGLSLLSVPMAGCLVSFGGYNGKYHNAVHVYRPEGFVVVKPPPRGGGGDGGASGVNRGGSGRLENGHDHHNNSKASQEAAAAAREATSHELSIMRRQLESAQVALSAAEQAADEAKDALEKEEAKGLKLEVEVAELRAALGRMGELERELAKYRTRDSEDAEAGGGKKGSGIWGYITGADATAAIAE